MYMAIPISKINKICENKFNKERLETIKPELIPVL